MDNKSFKLFSWLTVISLFALLAYLVFFPGFKSGGENPYEWFPMLATVVMLGSAYSLAILVIFNNKK